MGKGSEQECEAVLEFGNTFVVKSPDQWLRYFKHKSSD